MGRGWLGRGRLGLSVRVFSPFLDPRIPRRQPGSPEVPAGSAATRAAAVFTPRYFTEHSASKSCHPAGKLSLPSTGAPHASELRCAASHRGMALIFCLRPRTRKQRALEALNAAATPFSFTRAARPAAGCSIERLLAHIPDPNQRCHLNCSLFFATIRPRRRRTPPKNEACSPSAGALIG